jgi:hypothetical protein
VARAASVRPWASQRKVTSLSPPSPEDDQSDDLASRRTTRGAVNRGRVEPDTLRSSIVSCARVRHHDPGSFLRARSCSWPVFERWIVTNSPRAGPRRGHRRRPRPASERRSATAKTRSTTRSAAPSVASSIGSEQAQRTGDVGRLPGASRPRNPRPRHPKTSAPARQRGRENRQTDRAELISRRSAACEPRLSELLHAALAAPDFCTNKLPATAPGPTRRRPSRLCPHAAELGLTDDASGAAAPCATLRAFVNERRSISTWRS